MLGGYIPDTKLSFAERLSRKKQEYYDELDLSVCKEIIDLITNSTVTDESEDCSSLLSEVMDTMSRLSLFSRVDLQEKKVSVDFSQYNQERRCAKKGDVVYIVSDSNSAYGLSGNAYTVAGVLTSELTKDPQELGKAYLLATDRLSGQVMLYMIVLDEEQYVVLVPKSS